MGRWDCYSLSGVIARFNRAIQYAATVRSIIELMVTGCPA
jgi:hypothetical protein